jgi:hypothetical protein
VSNDIKSHPSDDPDFIALINRIAVKLFEQNGIDEVFIIEIKNWFDHKWLKFSGIGRVPFNDPRDSHPQVALDEFWQEKLTFPPFTPNRVLQQQWHPTAAAQKTKSFIHRRDYRQHSCWNLQRRVAQFANSALFIWFSSGTKNNDRGSLMVYQVQTGASSCWYASFQKTAGWVLNRTKEIPRGAVEKLMEPFAAAKMT